MLQQAPQERESRSGRPWTHQEDERLVALVRDGAELDAIAEQAGRSISSVVSRLRRMLPLVHRSCPTDRVASALRGHLSEPGYDWQATMLLTPPPRPVVHPPAIVHKGLAGLPDDDLVRVAHSVLLDDRAATADLRGRLIDELGKRGLRRQVTDAHETYLTTLREPVGIGDVSEWVRRWSVAIGLVEDRYSYGWSGGPW